MPETQKVVLPFPRYSSRPRTVSALPSAQHSPAQNHVLAALPQDYYKRLLPSLEFVQLPLGGCVHRSGEISKYLYFPTAGIVSNGALGGFAVTGREGVIGIESIMGNECSRIDSVTLIAGYAYRMATEVAKNEFNLGGPIRELLLRYAQAWITALAQTAVCHRHHSVEQQFCHWLLMCLDRVPGNELPVAQEMIASLLDVRHEALTAAARKLQQEGLIYRDHGKIIVRDRSNLRADACECYGVVELEYARLIRLRARSPIGQEGKEHSCHLDGSQGMPGNQGRADTRCELSDEAWREMVSTAAYFRAEARSFRDGLAEDDWYGAEAELRERFGAADNDEEKMPWCGGDTARFEATGE